MMKKLLLLLCLFTTLPKSWAQVLDYQDFNTGTLGWTEVHTLGTSIFYGWGSISTINDITTTPYEGNRMARFGSFFIDAGNVYELRSPAISFENHNYKVKFKMYREGSFPNASDNIQVYYNTVPGIVGGTLLGTINRSKTLSPPVPLNDWYSYDFTIPTGSAGTGYLTLLSTSAHGNSIFIDTLSIEQVPENDVENKALVLNDFILNGLTPISGMVKNIGLNPITSMDINWQADSGPIHTQSLTGLAILSDQSYSYTHNALWDATAGSHSVRTWVSNTNGNGIDSDPTNNEITKTIEVVNEIFPRTVVYEVSTGTWCGWCVRSHVGLKDMTHYHSDGSFIGIAVHNFNNYDPLQVDSYNSGMAAYNGGVYPNGTANRTALQLDPSYIELGYQAILNKTPLGKVTITSQTWNPATRQITFDAQAIFARTIENANYNLAAVIVEDGVTGTANGYNQSNYYAAQGTDIIDWEGINWKNLGNPIPATSIVYNHVARALLGGFTGIAGSVPSSVIYNSAYSHTFTYTLPATENPNAIKLVALLLDHTTGQIVNANEVSLSTSLGTSTFETEKATFFPNPTKGLLYVTAPKTTRIEIIDLTGKIVFSSTVSSGKAIDIAAVPKGIYLIKLEGIDFVTTDKLILE